jgi:F-type H+-transporting ATPase subunit alpha
VDRVKDFQNKLQEYLGTRKASVLAAIRDKKALDKENEAPLKAAVEEFKQTFR